MKTTFIFLLICIIIFGCSGITSFAEVFSEGYQYDSLEAAIDRIEVVEKDNVVTTSEAILS